MEHQSARSDKCGCTWDVRSFIYVLFKMETLNTISTCPNDQWVVDFSLMLLLLVHTYIFVRCTKRSSNKLPIAEVNSMNVILTRQQNYQW